MASIYCNICINEVYTYVTCLHCQIICCKKCHRYGNELDVFSEITSGRFYCSMSCILERHRTYSPYFFTFLEEMYNSYSSVQSLFYRKMYFRSQERAYTLCIVPQIKKLVNDVILADIGNVICEYVV